ncbi:hypothetical protein [Providencia sneebia]|uniref:Uncharacterized protein n=1 Tax=Providencia sneebia DSM 19967 TaxID=1141660 RepID=K8WMR1_9GAMM|nr:hypothetical protein [Providencia sneebia]EKT57445.1 hypothetical protein OO7_08650 [Providencia sneebia DSM 19967]
MQNQTIIDTGNWPVCVLNTFPATMDETRLWLEEMDSLLNKERIFTLIYPPIEQPKGQPSQEVMEAKKYVRRWLKTAKSQMMQYCRAMIITLQPEGEDREEMERLAPMISTLYGPEVFIDNNMEDAKKRAITLVSE